MDQKYVGIEIGGTKLQIVFGDDSGGIQRRWRHTVDRFQGAAGIRKHIEATLSELTANTQLHGVGIGFGGPVNWQTGRICRSHQIEGWSDFEIVEWIQALTHSPVRVDNDANVAALGEAQYGAGKGADPVFYVTLGSGVGGGLVGGGGIYHGAQPGEAEIGHIRLDRAGTIVENRCSGWAVDRRIREVIRSQPESPLARLAAGESGGEAKHLAAALNQNDPVAKRLLAETAEDLAFALSHVSHLFHPQVIVMGGGLSLLGEPLRMAVAEALAKFVMEAFSPGPRVMLSALREDAVPIGALALARLAG